MILVRKDILIVRSNFQISAQRLYDRPWFPRKTGSHPSHSMSRETTSALSFVATILFG
jgi:hypothetical protein